MSCYVLDTDVLSDVLFDDPIAVSCVLRIQQEEDSRIFVSEISRLEFLSLRDLTAELERKVDELLRCFDEVIAVDEVIARKAAEIRRLSNGPGAICEKCGKRSGGKLKTPDAIIAATALTEEAILVTRNVKDYRQLEDLVGLQIRTPEALTEAQKNKMER